MGKHLIIIGGNSGMGHEFFKSARAYGPYTSISVPDPSVMDVTDISRIDWFFKGWGRGTSEIDLAYFAGYNRLMALGEINSSSLRHSFAVNVEGFINVINSMCANGWKDQKVNVCVIASDAARIPMRHSIAYCSSKAALVMAVRCAARELAPSWRVNAVSPGIVAGTPMTEYIDREVPKLRGWTLEQANEYERSMIPMGRRATKAEVAEVVLSTLQGPEYLTGANIELNGGK